MRSPLRSCRPPSLGSATPAVFRSGCRIGAGGRSSFSTRTSERSSRLPGSGRKWPVSMQADSDARMQTDDIGRFYVQNGDRAMVPLSTLVTLSKVYGPTYTNRFNLYRAVQLLGGAAPGYSSGQALNALEEVAKATLPPDMGYDFADLSYQERKASGTIVATFGLSIVFVFLILAGLYESWSLPFSVLLSVPIAVL